MSKSLARVALQERKELKKQQQLMNQEEKERRGGRGRRRIAIDLNERKPIGLELDFSEEETEGAGVRVSRVEAGLAKTLGVVKEDRLTFIGDEDIRGIDVDRIREMLLEPSYPTRLVFEEPRTRSDDGDGPPPSGVATLTHTLLRQKEAPSKLAEAGPAASKPRVRKRRRDAKGPPPPPLVAPMPPPSAPPPAPPPAAPPAPPIHGDLIEQLDFLVAQQRSELGAGADDAVAPLTSSSRPSSQEKDPSRASPSSPLPRDSTAAALRNRRRRNRSWEGSPREKRPTERHKRREREQLRARGREEDDEVVVIDTPPEPPSNPDRIAGGKETESREEAEGGEAGTGAKGGSGSGFSKSFLPAWLGVLTSLGLGDVAGTDAARAAIVLQEVQVMLAKELAALQLARKVSAHVNLAQYADFRGRCLRTCPGYSTLKTLREQYLVDHHDELADIAETSFVSNLLGEASAKATSPRAKAAASPSLKAEEVKDDRSPLLRKSTDLAREMTMAKSMAPRVEFVRESHNAMQGVIRRSLACHERALDMTVAHRVIRRQSLLDVKDGRGKGKKTEQQAAIVIAKIRGWEKGARVSETVAVQLAGAVTERAEGLRDAVELLMDGLEMQKRTLDRLATFRLLNGPTAEGWQGRILP